MSIIDRDALVREVLTLRDQVDELQEEVRQLKEAMTPIVLYPAAWRLTVMESRLLHALRRAKGAPLGKESILVSLYGFGAEVDAKIVDVMICKMRKKLAPHGIAFANQWGVGFSITPASLPVIAAATAPIPTRRAA